MKSNLYYDEKIAVSENGVEFAKSPLVYTKDLSLNRHFASRHSRSAKICLQFAFVLLSIISVLALHLISTNGEIPDSWYSTYILKRLSGSGSTLLLLPTALAVIYGFAWTYISIDSRLAQQAVAWRGSASSSQPLWSCFLDQVAFSPIRAIHKRQWPTFVSSAVMLLILWGLIPSQVGILYRGFANHNETLPLSLKSGYTTLEQEPTIISKDAMVSVYRDSFHSSRPPVDKTHTAFKTDTAVFTPFETPDDIILAKDGEVWTYPTTEYSMDLNCQAARIITHGEKQYYTSDFDCFVPRNATLEMLYEETSGTALSYKRQPFSASYAGYGDPALALCQWHTDAKTLMFATLTKNEPHQADNNDEPAAIFCKPQLYAEEVGAAVLMPSMQTRTIHRGAAKRNLPPSDMFKAGTFMQELHNLQTVRYNDAGEPADNYQMLTWGDAFDFSKSANLKSSGPPIMAYALMSSRHSLDYLSKSSERLALAYQDVIQRYFAEAIHERLGKTAGPEQTVEAMRTFSRPSILVAQTPLRAAQCCLALITLLTLWLTGLTAKQSGSYHQHTSSAEPATLLEKGSYDLGLVSRQEQRRETRRYFLVSILALATAFAVSYLYFGRHLRA